MNTREIHDRLAVLTHYRNQGEEVIADNLHIDLLRDFAATIARIGNPASVKLAEAVLERDREEEAPTTVWTAPNSLRQAADSAAKELIELLTGALDAADTANLPPEGAPRVNIHRPVVALTLDAIAHAMNGSRVTLRATARHITGHTVGEIHTLAGNAATAIGAWATAADVTPARAAAIITGAAARDVCGQREAAERAEQAEITADAAGNPPIDPWDCDWDCAACDGAA